MIDRILGGALAYLGLTLGAFIVGAGECAARGKLLSPEQTWGGFVGFWMLGLALFISSLGVVAAGVLLAVRK